MPQERYVTHYVVAITGNDAPAIKDSNGCMLDHSFKWKIKKKKVLDVIEFLRVRSTMDLILWHIFGKTL